MGYFRNSLQQCYEQCAINVQSMRITDAHKRLVCLPLQQIWIVGNTVHLFLTAGPGPESICKTNFASTPKEYVE